MKTLLHCLLLAISLATAHAAPLKVVTWNLEWFPGKRPTASEREAKDHMKDARAALLKINPDVFIGVEVRDWAAFDELVSAVPGLNNHVVSNFVAEMTAAGFCNTWAGTPKKDRLTWVSRPDSEFEPTTFDYFFTLGLGDLKATLQKSPEEVSDHRAILLTLP